MAEQPKYPSREYYLHDVGEIPHPDDSQFTHNHIRYGWSKGQQLWGPDVNGNFEWINFWFARWTHYRRKFRAAPPPYYTGPSRYYLLDPKHYTPAIFLENNPDVVNTVGYQTPGETSYYMPWPGTRCTVLADRMLVAYSQGEWKAAARFEKHLNVEIAIFASAPKANSVIARWVVDQPIRLFPNEKGRCRGWSIYAASIRIRKNGVVIGLARQSPSTSFARMSLEVDLMPGDVLDLYAEGPVYGSKNTAVSIIGTLI